LIGFFTQESVFSQTMDSVYIIVDTMPNFNYKTYDNIGEKLTEYFRDNSELKILKFKEETNSYKGLILLNFIVEKDGSLTSIESKTIGFETDTREIEKLLIKTEKWKPGFVKGKAVRVYFTFPLNVILEE